MINNKPFFCSFSRLGLVRFVTMCYVILKILLSLIESIECYLTSDNLVLYALLVISMKYLIVVWGLISWRGHKN